MLLLRRYSLPLTVFMTGGAVLIVEIVAVRILSPYYGSTIFTVSSVISVILAALSVGYYAGGKLADKHPSLKLFYGIIFASGIGVLFIQLLSSIFLPLLGNSLSIVSGPLISAAFLFFLPALLLGMLSPFAIKLQSVRFPDIGIGTLSGEIFFWSTLGSIFGSLSAGFLLIPNFGISKIMTATGILLTLLGAIPLIKSGVKGDKIFAMLIIFFFTIGAVAHFRPPTIENLVYETDGIYERITIFDAVINGLPARFLKQDRGFSAAAFLGSDELVFEYTKFYSIYKLFKPEAKEVLFIGGGAYSMPKILLGELPEANIDVVEIEPSLFDIAKSYFEVPDDPRLNNHVEDGRRFLHDSEKNYDLIFSDAYYSLYSIPAHLTTKEFFQLVHDKLEPDGMFYANILANPSRQGKSLLFSEMRTFLSVFPNSYFFAVDSPGLLTTQNIIFVSQKGNKELDFESAQIREHENPIIRSLGGKLINPVRFELSNYPILTDDFSPVESLTAKLVKDIQKETQGTKIDGNEMLAIIAQQLRYGPRYLSADGHKRVQEFLIAEMDTFADESRVQEWIHTSADGTENELVNIMGRFYPDKNRRVILGTHFDSRRFADRDPETPSEPVPGANDSASGVAVLAEIARILSTSGMDPEVGIDIVFFDGEEGEENLSIDTWQPIGSTYFSERLGEFYDDRLPINGVVVDMVCDSDLNLKSESSSLYYAGEFVNKFEKQLELTDKSVVGNPNNFAIWDDHTALNEAGIPSFLVIDFDYLPWHTTGDTLDKCSANSLETVAQSVLNYIYSL